MRKIKGSVTLFVAMIFLLVITVIMTVITSARIQGAGIMVSTSVSCSLDSVFAGYDNELFDKFGVLLFKGEDKETVISQLNGYLKDNIENTTGLDLYEIELKGIELESLTNITEYGGLLWFEEAVEYEKYAKVINWQLIILILKIPRNRLKQSKKHWMKWNRYLICRNI